MAVAHTTLLEFLGKKITYDLAVDQSFDPSGYIEESGTVTAVLFELDGDHQFCVKIDGFSDTHEFIKLSEIKLKS
jgi:hypothetical protein